MAKKILSELKMVKKNLADAKRLVAQAELTIKKVEGMQGSPASMRSIPKLPQG
jgi:hypothetical protein